MNLGFLTLTHAVPSIIAAFLASLVEFVEALTIILAVGSIRSWRDAVLGAVVALVVLVLIVTGLGTTLTHIRLADLQLIIGGLLLLFGLRWLRKAVLRAAGVIPLHDEQAAFAQQTKMLQHLRQSAKRWDQVAFATSFQITMLEGMEVVFIVIAIGAGGDGLLMPAAWGALAALVLVVLLGLVLHRPLSKIPENNLKFIVGVLLSAFGCFWVGEGGEAHWPGQDGSIPGLVIWFLLIALAAVPYCRWQSARSVGRNRSRATLGSKKSELSKDCPKHWFKAIMVEIFGLFVDDVQFAAAILVWSVVAVILLPLIGIPALLAGPVLAFGLAMILLAGSVYRAQR